MAYDLPEGYEDEAEFIKEARERFQEAASHDFKNREEGRADLKFFAGEQWAEDDIQARAGRPCLTINTLPQFVAQITGDMRINRPSIKARPAEDADKDLADVREGQIRAIEHQSNALKVYVDTGQDQVACGIGNFRCVLDYLSDDVFERDIFIRPIPNPFAVVWDPLITDATGRDARYCFVEEMWSRKVFEAKYGNEVPSELSDTLQTNNWMTTDTVRVTEYWVIKEREYEIALLQDGSIEEITPKNRLKIMQTVQRNGAGKPMVRKTKGKTVCMYLISGTKILEKPVEYKIGRIPVFRVPGWEVNLGDDTPKVRFGLVRMARDPARLKNYWRSVMAEKLALAPRQQWIIHEAQPGDQDDFRKAAQSGDTVLTWAGQIKPDRLEPPQIEAALMQEAALNSQDMKDVTGLHDASLGARSNETSGRAILARQKEGDVASYIYHDNLKAAIAECGRVINELIPAVYDTARTIRVLGADEQQKVIRVNDPGDPDSIDLSKGKYDIVVETGPSYSTRRVESAESMMAFVQAVPAAAQVAGDLIAKAQDWPLADEIGERLKRTLPPNIVEDDKDAQDPQVMQAKAAAAQQAQQMQEMQQHALELELNDKAATVELKHAQAVKTLAEAKAAGAAPQEEAGETPLDQALKEAQVRKANADADKAQAEAGLAYFTLQQTVADPRKVIAEADKAEADAASAHIGAASALLDLQHKPTEQELAKKTTEKALKEPPKQAAKPAK